MYFVPWFTQVVVDLPWSSVLSNGLRRWSTHGPTVGCTVEFVFFLPCQGFSADHIKRTNMCKIAKLFKL